MSADEFLIRVIKPWLAKEPTRPEAELTSEEVMKALEAYDLARQMLIGGACSDYYDSRYLHG